MWAGMITILFGALLVSGSPITRHCGPGAPSPSLSIELFVFGSFVMGLGVLQIVLSGRRRRRQVADSLIVGAFREPPALSPATRQAWHMRAPMAALVLFTVAVSAGIALLAYAFLGVGV